MPASVLKNICFVSIIRHLCDGRWECPFGDDEGSKFCEDYQCVGFLHCFMENMTICVHPSSICDGVSDCAAHDDEMLCDLPRQCPSGCTCLMYAAKCASSFLSIFVMSPLFKNIVFCKLTNVTFLVRTSELGFGQYRTMISFFFIDSMLEDICDSTPSHNHTIQHLDFSSNQIFVLSESCFCGAPSLKVLILASNKLRCIHKNAFYELKALQLLNVSDNFLATLDAFFAKQAQQLTIDISSNEVTTLNIKLAQSLNVKRLWTDTFRLCYFFKHSPSVCPLEPQWPDNCKKLLQRTAVEWMTMAKGLGIVFLNVVTSALLWTQLKSSMKKYISDPTKKVDTKSDAYILSLLITSANDALFGIHLILLSSSSFHFAEVYVLRAKNWLSSAPCIALALMFMFVTLTSLFLSNFVMASRFVAVKLPFKIFLKEKNNIWFCVKCGAGLIAILCTSCLLSYMLGESQMFMPSKICSMVGDTKSSVTVFALTILFAFTQLGSFGAISIQYLIMYKEITKPKLCSSTMTQRKKKSSFLVLKIIAHVLCNALCWVSSAVILTMSIALSQFPFEILTWNTVLINPLNCLFGPVLFTLLPWIKQKYRKCKTAKQND